MLRKLFCGLMAVALLFTTSCEHQDLTPTVGGEVTVSVNVSTPEISTRSYSDGMTANKLQYAVYHMNDEQYGTISHETTDVEMKDGTKTLSLQLTAGETYKIILWADAYGEDQNSPYNVNFRDKTMIVDYTNMNVVSNNESLDAFYAVKEFTVNGAQTETVKLRRPFAQLNIGTNDYAEAQAASGYVPTQSSVTVKGIYNTLNLADGTVSATDGFNGVVTFGFADINTNETFPVTGYDYVAMNYLLVAKDKETVDEVEFTLKGGTITKTRTVSYVPVQRNYRTNIYGSILTSDVDVNVEINPDYVGNLVFDVFGLQEALDSAPENETTTIYLGADIIGDVTDVQKEGRKIVIEGGNNKYVGTIKVHSNSYYYADAALTIKNLNFETATASVNFIEALENGSERYSSDITVENCTFTATGEAVNTSVGVQVKATRGVTVKNCTATNMHSLIQAQSCDTGDVKVEYCTVNGKNGVAFKQVKSAKVEGTTINAAAYGIRFDGNTDNYGITVKENEVTASQPFIVRKMTGQNNTIALEGDNTLTVSAASISTETPAYQIIITNGSDDEAYVKPTGTYTLTGADDYLVYPRDVYFFVATWDEFTAALAANEPKIKLTADITYDANYQLQKSVILDLGGKSMTLPMINIHTQTTVKNGTINGKVYARKNSEIVFNNVKFSGAVADNLSTEGHLAIQGGCKSLYAKDCLFSPTSVSGSQTKPLSFEGGSTIMKFENCEFKSSPYKKQVYFNSLSATGSLDFTNCNFNNKTPNIMFAAACPLTNLTMSGTTKLSSVTLEINRAKDTVTEEEWAHISSLIANNKFTQVRVFYAGGSSEYIK